MSEIRRLVAGDVPDLVELSRQARWNQTAADWQRLLDLCPEGCIGIESGGHIISSTTVTGYGNELAWIGMVLTDKDHRGNGYAGRLMEQALAWLRGRGVAWIKLDATDMGQPIYARLGFQDECPVERWKRPAGTGKAIAAGVPPPGPFVYDDRLEADAFGAIRRELIESLAGIEAASIPGEGYAMGRPGAIARYFGPCVAGSVAAARRLLEWYVDAHGSEDIFWDLLPENENAVLLAREHGFAPVRHLVRMGMRGRPGAAPLVHNDTSVFAIAGFEYG
jgi:GNAT superfamily N-acetyltransferase